MQKLLCPTDCPFLQCSKPINPVYPDGPIGGLLVVGEAPGEKEVLSGEGFVGIAGKNLTAALNQAGLARHQWSRTNAVWCRPQDDKGKNRKPTHTEIRCCENNLIAAIRRLNPKVILAVGESGASACLAYDKKKHGLFLPYLIGQQQSYPHYGTQRFTTYQGILVVIMPHTSPLSWNRKYQDEPIRTIGQRSVEIAVALAH